MRLLRSLAFVCCSGLGLAAAAVPAAAPQLRGTAGPGFSITLQDAAGTIVSRLDPGTYELAVRDLSVDHNFHLFGPGVEEMTSVDAIEDASWTVSFRQGRYTYLCDLHPTQMVRELVVGNPPAPTPPPSPPAAAPKLLATIGPGRTITLRSARGAVLRKVKPGSYRIVVRDRTKAHNFHLVGKGVNRRTGIAATGVTTWSVKLVAGTLRFYSDRSPKTIRGSVVVG